MLINTKWILFATKKMIILRSTYYHPNNNKNLNIEANCCHGVNLNLSRIFKMRVSNFVVGIYEIMLIIMCVATVGVASA
jgi:hypothetical protein